MSHNSRQREMKRRSIPTSKVASNMNADDEELSEDSGTANLFLGALKAASRASPTKQNDDKDDASADNDDDDESDIDNPTNKPACERCGNLFKNKNSLRTHFNSRTISCMETWKARQNKKAEVQKTSVKKRLHDDDDGEDDKNKPSDWKAEENASKVKKIFEIGVGNYFYRDDDGNFIRSTGNKNGSVIFNVVDIKDAGVANIEDAGVAEVFSPQEIEKQEARNRIHSLIAAQMQAEQQYKVSQERAATELNAAYAQYGRLMTSELQYGHFKPRDLIDDADNDNDDK